MKLRTKITAACLLLSCCAAAQVGYTYKPFENPGATVTRVFGMNNHGYVVGMDDSTPGRHAFLLNKKTYIPLDPTGTLGTHTSFARGVNNLGDVVGGYFDDAGNGRLTSGDFRSRNWYKQRSMTLPPTSSRSTTLLALLQHLSPLPLTRSQPAVHQELPLRPFRP